MQKKVKYAIDRSNTSILVVIGDESGHGLCGKLKSVLEVLLDVRLVPVVEPEQKTAHGRLAFLWLWLGLAAVKSFKQGAQVSVQLCPVAVEHANLAFIGQFPLAQLVDLGTQLGLSALPLNESFAQILVLNFEHLQVKVFLSTNIIYESKWIKHEEVWINDLRPNRLCRAWGASRRRWRSASRAAAAISTDCCWTGKRSNSGSCPRWSWSCACRCPGCWCRSMKRLPQYV